MRLLVALLLLIMASTAEAENCQPGSECWAMLRAIEESGKRGAELVSAQQALQLETELLREAVKKLSNGRVHHNQLQAELSISDEQLSRIIDAIKPKVDPPRQQFDPSLDLRKYYPGARFRTAVISVPDPRVPRLRLNYDLVVGALLAAASHQGYRFHRYYSPFEAADTTGRTQESAMQPTPTQAEMDNWRKQWLCGPETQTVNTEKKKFCAEFPRAQPKVQFGIMVLAGDRLGVERGSANSMLVLYLAPERLSFGLEPFPFIQALVRAQLQACDLREPFDPVASSCSRDPIQMVGPNYGEPEQVSELLEPLKLRVDRFGLYGQCNSFQSAQQFLEGREEGEALVVHDDFGASLNEPKSHLRVPANIWDSRSIAQPNDGRLSAFFNKPEMSLGSDRGHEFPEQYSEILQVRGERLAFKAAARAAKAVRYIYVDMQDIRDQLYVAEQLHNMFPGVQFTFPRANRLLAHPAYIDVTRGAKVLARESLNSALSFANDEAAAHFRALQRMIVISPEVLLWLRTLDAYFLSLSAPTSLKETLLKWASTTEQEAYIVTRTGLQLESQQPPTARERMLVMITFAGFMAFVGWAQCRRLFVGAWWRSPSLLGVAALLVAVTLLFGMGIHLIPTSLRSGISPTHAYLFAALALVIVVMVLIRFWQLFMQHVIWGNQVQRAFLSLNWRNIGELSFLAVAIISLIYPLLAGFAPPIGERTWPLSAVSLLFSTVPALLLHVLLISLFRLKRLEDSIAPSLPAEIASHIGNQMFPRYSTPLEAWPDQKIPLGVVPQFGLLRQARMLLGTMLMRIRWLAILALIVPMLGIFAVYASPLPAQSALLYCQLAYLLLACLLTHIAALVAESSKTCSRVFCGNDTFSIGARLTTYLLVPIAIAAIGIFFALKPGMRDSTQGLLEWLLGYL
jgi:hypothetical protein